MSEVRVTRTVRLEQSAAEVWGRVTTPEGINYELRPLLRMTMPPALRGRRLDPAEIPVGTALGRSWILLLGLIPADYDDLRIVELEPPRRFLERSRTLNFDPWVHERIVEPDGDGCTVTDRLSFRLRPLPSRIPGAERIACRVVSALFGHRHRRLQRRDTCGP